MDNSTPSNTLCKLLLWVGLAVLILGLLVGAVGMFWGYNIAADAPHTRLVNWVLQTTRDHSIAVRAKDISVPSDLGQNERIKAGAAEYAEMCSGCHNGPGLEKSEISQGLYPRAPELAHGGGLSPAEQFWVIKHGIKMTGMSAWGVTHSDKIVWDMVAFLQKLPSLSADQYRALTKDASKEHDEMKAMPGMNQ